MKFCFFFPSLLRNLPAKMPRLSTSNEKSTSNIDIEIPHILQGEIARLDRKFKVAFETSVQSGSKVIKLICSLDDPYLPCVPSMYVYIPNDYPSTSPTCTLLEHEINATPFFASIQKAFSAQLSKLPTLYSLSHVLDTWEMSIRYACSPNSNSNIASVASVALGV